MKDKIERLERQLLAIQTELDTLKNPTPEPEIDWEAMVGRLVEVRDNDDEEWLDPSHLKAYHPDKGFHAVEECWQQARLYTGPTSINWIKHDGSDECPVDEGVRVFHAGDSNFEYVDYAGDVLWPFVTHYSVIESKPQ